MWGGLAEMSDSNRIDPYTEQAAERLENGFQDACGSLTIEIAEVGESIDDELVKDCLDQAQHCLNVAKKVWNDRYQDTGSDRSDAPR